jgi:DNA/RNA-binding domain of Phe-tRNA-synthetase-like protein
MHPGSVRCHESPYTYDRMGLQARACPRTMAAMRLTLDPSAAGRLRLGYVVLDDVTVGPSADALHAEVEALGERMRELYAGREPSQIPELSVARRLYRSIGVDPTRTRPSSEALLRRMLKGQGLYRINSVVDAGNLFSLELLLPIGLYDLERVEGDVVAGVGGAGEGYDGIRKDRINVEGKVVLRDRLGPFGNPSADSLRTSIRDVTRQVLLTVFVPADYPEDRLDRALARADELQGRFSGAKCVERGLLG